MKSTKTKNREKRMTMKRGKGTLEVVRWPDGETTICTQTTWPTTKWSSLVLTKLQTQKLKGLLK